MNANSLYSKCRKNYLKNLSKIEAVERRYRDKMLGVMKRTVDDLYLDFTSAPGKLLPFWVNYPPEQRGRMPKGTSIPWLELGEKTISFNLIKEISDTFEGVRFPGLPTGGDIRFSTKDAFIHLDVKLTGPNDNPDEVVVPPNQVSGLGNKWNRKGLANDTWPVLYQRSGEVNYNFQPKLPPLYILDNKPLLCVTMFLKAVYTVESFGIHPLKYFELVCVPNGLLLFDGPRYASTEGLIISGKDEKSKAEDTKRIRIRLDPLSKIGEWRTVKLKLNKDKWKEEPRNVSRKA